MKNKVVWDKKTVEGMEPFFTLRETIGKARRFYTPIEPIFEVRKAEDETVTLYRVTKMREITYEDQYIRYMKYYAEGDLIASEWDKPFTISYEELSENYISHGFGLVLVKKEFRE